MTEMYTKDNPYLQKVDLTVEVSVPFDFKSIHKEKLRKVIKAIIAKKQPINVEALIKAPTLAKLLFLVASIAKISAPAHSPLIHIPWHILANMTRKGLIKPI